MGVLIGLSGRIGAGKTTVAQHLIGYMPEYGFVEKSFAYNVKLISSIISGLPFEDMVSQSGKNIVLPIYNDITVGQLQQKIGTDLFREHFDDMVWIKSLFAPYKKDIDNCKVEFDDTIRQVRKRGRLREKHGGNTHTPRGRPHGSTSQVDARPQPPFRNKP